MTKPNIPFQPTDFNTMLTIDKRLSRKRLQDRVYRLVILLFLHVFTQRVFLASNKTEIANTLFPNQKNVLVKFIKKATWMFLLNIQNIFSHIFFLKFPRDLIYITISPSFSKYHHIAYYHIYRKQLKYYHITITIF